MNRRVVLFVLAVSLVACNINPNIDTSAMTEGFDKCVDKIAQMELLPPELVALAVASIGDQPQCEEKIKVVNVCDQSDDPASDPIVLDENDNSISMTVTICVPTDPNCYDAYYDEQWKLCRQVDNGLCPMADKLNALCDDEENCTQDWFIDGECKHKNFCDDGSKDYILCPPERVAACDDHNPCTEDSCDPYSGKCFYVKIHDATDCASVYNQDGNCVFQLPNRNHVMVEAFDHTIQFLYGGIDLHSDQGIVFDYYDSLQMRMGGERVMGLGEFTGIPTILSAYKDCYGAEHSVNILVVGSDQCNLEALQYPTGTQGIHVTYEKYAFESEYYEDILGLSSTHEAAMYYQKNFDVVVVCEDFAGEKNYFNRLTAEMIKYLLDGENSIDLAIVAVVGFAQEYQPSSMPIDYKKLRSWRLFNVAAGMLGLNFDFFVLWAGKEDQLMTARMKLK